MANENAFGIISCSSSYTAFDLEHYLSRLSVRVDRCGLVEATRTALGKTLSLFCLSCPAQWDSAGIQDACSRIAYAHPFITRLPFACVNELKHTAHRPPFSSIRPKSWRSSVNLMRASPPILLCCHRHSGKSHRNCHQSKYFQCLFHRI